MPPAVVLCMHVTTVVGQGLWFTVHCYLCCLRVCKMCDRKQVSLLDVI